MKRLASLLLFCALSAGCASGPAHSHLLGLVLDGESGAPIELAEVRIEGAPGGPFTSDDEGYVVADAPSREAPYEVSVTAKGYAESVFEIVLQEHEHKQTIKLQPEE